MNCTQIYQTPMPDNSIYGVLENGDKEDVELTTITNEYIKIDLKDGLSMMFVKCK